MTISAPILIANKGTCHELTISPYQDRTGHYFWLDNISDRTGSKIWSELPRTYRTIKGCKLGAAKLLGEPQKWEAPEQGGDA